MSAFPVLTPELERELAAQARAAYPRECCGVLLGRVADGGTQVVLAWPGRNLHPTPARAFELDPAAVVGAELHGRTLGLELVGFYHSHPDRPPRPSAADEGGAWEGHLAAITGVGADGATCTRLFRRTGGRLHGRAPGPEGDSRPPARAAQVERGAGPKGDWLLRLSRR